MNCENLLIQAIIVCMPLFFIIMGAVFGAYIIARYEEWRMREDKTDNDTKLMSDRLEDVKDETCR